MKVPITFSLDLGFYLHEFNGTVYRGGRLKSQVSGGYQERVNPVLRFQNERFLALRNQIVAHHSHIPVLQNVAMV